MSPSVLALFCLACVGHAAADSEVANRGLGKAMSNAFVPARTFSVPSSSSMLQQEVHQLQEQNDAMKVELERFQSQIEKMRPQEQNQQQSNLRLGFGVLGFGISGVLVYSIIDKLVSSRRNVSRAPEVQMESSPWFSQDGWRGKVGGFDANPSLAPEPIAPLPESEMFGLDDLKELATQLNPVIGYWDPLKLAEGDFWGQGNKATIAWLRHAEIKHGRVAMMGFVGYMVHENGIQWGLDWGKWMPPAKAFEGLSAPAVWDKSGFFCKLSIILGAGFMEFCSESSWMLARNGERHYMKGGKPGYMPPLTSGVPLNGVVATPPLDYFDPLGTSKWLTEAQKKDKLTVEINNGRLAMIGLMGFISEAKIPGSVPGLKGLVKAYDGDVMAPFVVS